MRFHILAIHFRSFRDNVCCMGTFVAAFQARSVSADSSFDTCPLLYWFDGVQRRIVATRRCLPKIRVRSELKAEESTYSTSYQCMVADKSVLFAYFKTIIRQEHLQWDKHFHMGALSLSNYAAFSLALHMQIASLVTTAGSSNTPKQS